MPIPSRFRRSGRKWMLLFGLTVILPSLLIGLLALRAFKGELGKLIHPLLDAYREVFVLANDPTGVSPLVRKHFPQLDALVVITSHAEGTLGYVVDAQALAAQGERRLTD